MRKSPVRRAGVAALVLLLASAYSLVAAGTASAAPLAASVAAASKPTIFTSTASQPAGNLTVTVSTAVAVGDTVTIAVDDNDAAANCAASNDTVGFSATPTVATASTVNPAPAFSAAVSASLGGCTTATVNDTLTLTATASSAAGTHTITLTGVKYTVGSAAGVGDVTLSVNGGGFSTTGSNATIANVHVTTNQPAVFIPSDATSVAISPIKLTETNAGAVTTGPLCVKISNGAFDPTGVPAVATTGGAAVAPPAAPSPTTAAFVVTTASTSAGSYTITGLKVIPAAEGFVVVTVGQNGACDSIGSGLAGFTGSVTRTAGGTRYATAQKIVDDNYGCLSGVDVVIARGDTFPDALAASYLAGSRGSRSS